MSVSKKEVSVSAHRALICKVEKLKLTTKDLREGCRKLRKDLNRIKLSRTSWKAKAVERREKCKRLEKRFLGQSRENCAKGHQYPIWLITLVVVLRIHCNCSYGSIRKIIQVMQADYVYGIAKQADIPCTKTLQNWVSKVGYHYLHNTDNESFTKDYCLIIDESMRIGTEKLFCAIICPSEKLSSGVLTFEDVQVIYLKGSQSWKGDKIAEELEKTLFETSIKISFMVSDEGTNLKRAARLLEIPHLVDISHLVATCLKKTFSEREDYKAFCIAVSKCQSKLAMGQYCYLRPCKQRDKALSNTT